MNKEKKLKSSDSQKTFRHLRFATHRFLNLVTDLLEVSSLQRLVSHLTEIHAAVVMALFPLQHSHSTVWTTWFLFVSHVTVFSAVCVPTFRQGGASRSVVSRKQPSDDFLLEPWRKRKQNWVSPRHPGKTAERRCG